MIAYIKGQILENNKSNIVLLNNNMGFEIFVLENTYYKENEEVSLFIKTIVREDDISLYGFKEKQEKYLFEKLLLVNGIGPKAAMNILSYIEPNVLIEAIINKDVDTMSKIKGLGKKTAEKIVLELHGKISAAEVLDASGDRMTAATETPVQTKLSLEDEDAVAALMGLGFTRSESLQAVKRAHDAGARGVEEIIMKALQGGM